MKEHRKILSRETRAVTRYGESSLRRDVKSIFQMDEST